jgi:hypothetical protein
MKLPRRSFPVNLLQKRSGHSDREVSSFAVFALLVPKDQNAFSVDELLSNGLVIDTPLLRDLQERVMLLERIPHGHTLPRHGIFSRVGLHAHFNAQNSVGRLVFFRVLAIAGATIFTIASSGLVAKYVKRISLHLVGLTDLNPTKNRTSSNQRSEWRLVVGAGWIVFQ